MSDWFYVYKKQVMNFWFLKNYKMNNTIIGKSTAAMMIAFLIGSCSNQNLKIEKDSFLSTLEIHLNAISSSNMEMLKPTVAEEVIMIGPDGATYEGKGAFIDLHKNWVSTNNWKWEGEILKTTYNDSLGYGLVKYRYTEMDSAGNESYQSNAYLALIFKNMQSGWQLIHDQNTGINDSNK